ncbi:N-acetylmuramoyl-L-alanine amidase [Catenovulum sediminis]|uniref:N-acetylmuramoyl-L-alanine amidase n=1 Tax=Catenovulum sediminis TaxID=1740262 RepID=A0ABV1RBN2_9ALTE
MKPNSVKYIVIHCSDTPDDREHTAADIHRWHKEFGWDGIGYHAVVQRSGKIEYGRPLYWPGAHVKNHNSNSIGVCLIGRHRFEQFQLSALSTFIKNLQSQFPNAKVVGHNELDPDKTCPNFDVQAWLKAQFSYS